MIVESQPLPRIAMGTQNPVTSFVLDYYITVLAINSGDITEIIILITTSHVTRLCSLTVCPISQQRKVYQLRIMEIRAAY